MKHFASRAVWEAYAKLPEQIRALADKNYAVEKRSAAPVIAVEEGWTIVVGARRRALYAGCRNRWRSGLVLDRSAVA
jgi:hypothetical protein